MNPVRQRLLWKLLLVNGIPVVTIIMVIWLALDGLAAGNFPDLPGNDPIPPAGIPQSFITSIHATLIWASLAALLLGFVLSYLLTRRVLKPLSQMNAVTRAVASGNFTARVEVTTGDEVGQLGISFNHMADSLERIEQLRRNMVADVAHELRTPLTNLRGYLEAVNDRVLPPSPETIDLLLGETLRLVKLVDNLQQLARADAARTSLHREKLVISKQLQEMLTLYRPSIEEKHLEVTTDFPPEADTVQADRDKFLQAVRNLLDNCVKYTPDGGQVAISSKRLDDGLEILFCNSGPAISSTDLPLIFERFFRTDRSRGRNAGGSGLGLAITRELIKAHGGRVGADSTDDRTCIRFTLPD
ncbi:HAMP domain-containing protein [Desulfoprunum benzoelyticum]|uniref:histidine kinase n=1 Tax=Desulfoprunum benzoelyticum TaxID=1506996 RepID=A0A840V6B7_9BACT|nr:ATP-binding protein [Desulfoprunum benzoelyticum]MBB5349450.1 signal transduction histidine kinase [Desulfoprunum benzoelyticum]MBM9531463.1 HAMP domain-containing protein [Desulfoprunum benzoelyticum]